MQRWRACCRLGNDAPRGWSLAWVKHFVHGHAGSILGAHRCLPPGWEGHDRFLQALQSLGQVACPPLLGRWWLWGWTNHRWVEGKRACIFEPIPSPDDRELCDRLCFLCDRLCFTTSIVGTNKPRCPGHGDKAGESWAVRGHWQMAFVRSTGLSWHSWGPQCQPGHESRPCPLQFPQQEALRNRTWILMCVYKMLLEASNDRQISSPLSTVPHYILPCASDQGSSASSLVWVVLKQHFCGSFQKITDIPLFPSAAESLPVVW